MLVSTDCRISHIKRLFQRVKSNFDGLFVIILSNNLLSLDHCIERSKALLTIDNQTAWRLLFAIYTNTFRSVDVRILP